MEIFEFWSKIGPQDRVHPADADVLSRVKHRFDLRCLPTPYMGPLKTAPVVILYLSPGFIERDVEEARTARAQSHHFARKRGDQPLPGPEFTGFDWWRTRTSCFGNWQDLRSAVAILDIGAYHAKTFADPHVLAALPSSRVSIIWAQDVLFPQAVAGQRVVVCLRAPHFWGLTTSEKPFGRGLFAPPVTRGGHMIHGPARERVLRAVDKILRLSGQES
jgi:hypothetical protein